MSDENSAINKPYSEDQITRAARDIIKIKRDSFYGSGQERQQLKNIRNKLDEIISENNQNRKDT